MAKSADHPTLAANHAAMLAASGIAPEIIAVRGYRTVRTQAELLRLGFSQAQRIVPTLLVPVHGVDGDIVTHQHRPDTPRANKSGKSVKYETVADSRMVLDVPLTVRSQVGNPAIPLFVTEGAKKADAAVSAGLCCIALLGVWNWRGRNEHGGTVALPDWEAIALKARKVFIVFDSDVTLKPQVHAALERFKAFLESRGATAYVVYLPSGPHGEKVGLDDFLAAGHTREELIALATTEIRRAPASAERESPYDATPDGFYYTRQTREGPVTSRLTNWTARIVGAAVRDDGVEEGRTLMLEGAVGPAPVSRFELSTAKFAAMTWPMDHLGHSAIIYPSANGDAHTRTAIQSLSDVVSEERVYTHSGWRETAQGWCYLHAGGAVGAAGRVENVRVDLGTTLARYALLDPPSGAKLAAAVRASLAVLAVAPDRTTVPLLGSAYRVALGAVDCGGHLSGPTGTFKTALAALVQQHFGAGLDAAHLPAAWSSTANALEAQAFTLKDAVMVVDDFAPRGSLGEQQQLHAKADRLLRAQGNGSGRSRLRADSTPRPTKPPRGFVLSTGEDIPSGQSLRARMWIAEVSPGDVDVSRLSACQRDADAGQYAAAMAGFVRWLAPKMAAVQAGLREQLSMLRDQAVASGQHRRAPGIIADLALGWGYFLKFATEIDALSQQEAKDYEVRVWQALRGVANAQAEHQAVSEPTQRFHDLLVAVLTSGAGHVADPDGDAPMPNPSAWGWRPGATSEIGEPVWLRQGSLIGWVDGNDLYLERNSALALAQRMARDSGDGLAISVHTLSVRLREKGALKSTDCSDPNGRLTVRKVLQGKRLRVLHLDANWLLSTDGGPSGPSDPVEPVAETSTGNAGLNARDEPQLWPALWPTLGQQVGRQTRQSGTHDVLSAARAGPQVAATAGNGSDGPPGPAFTDMRGRYASHLTRTDLEYERDERIGQMNDGADLAVTERPVHPNPVSEPL